MARGGEQYFYIVHPKQPDVQLYSNDGILLLYSSLDLAMQKLKSWDRALSVVTVSKI